MKNDITKHVKRLGGTLLHETRDHLVFELPNGHRVTVSRGQRAGKHYLLKQLRSKARKPTVKEGHR
jgi:hypothetical protein